MDITLDCEVFRNVKSAGKATFNDFNWNLGSPSKGSDKSKIIGRDFIAVHGQTFKSLEEKVPS